MAGHRILNQAEHAQVSAAVAAVEESTAGEIVTIVTDRSDDYVDVALAWCSVAAALALITLAVAPDFFLGLYDRAAGAWAQEWHARAIFTLAALVAALKFAAVWLIQLWPPLRYLLIPGPIKQQRVLNRAMTCFRIGAERRTRGRTGILIYLSMQEHRAEIIADEAIASKVSAEVWGDAMTAMLAHIREGRVADGMCAAVKRVGVVLAEHFPPAQDARNELPDRLIEV